MSWRVVVVTGHAKIDFRMNYLVIRSLENTRRVHISEIGVLILESTAISMTMAALCELLERRAKVIFCDRARNPMGEVVACAGSHDSTARIRRQIAWEQAAKQAVWTALIRAKIAGQRAVLRHWECAEASLLSSYLEQLLPGDPSNREGIAAKVYFRALWGDGFTRETPCPVNDALNYGYSLILSALNREIVAAGYLTQLGIGHDNTFNAFNLGCDLMEPLRPMVDQAVLQMHPTRFEREEKRALVCLLNSEVTFDGKRQVLLYALRLYAQSVFAALCEGDVGAIRLIAYEL